MGFFNFKSNKSANNSKAPVILQFNEEEIRVSAEEAEGCTIRELFEEHAAELGDVDRVRRFLAAGQIANGDDTVKLGTIYRASVASETKG